MKILKVFHFLKIFHCIKFNFKEKVKSSVKNRHFKEDLQKSLKTKKCEIVDLHNNAFLHGNWMIEDPQKRLSLKNTSREERSPEEIPEEEFTSNKIEIRQIVNKKSLTEINKPMNPYEMRENMPIKTKNSGYRLEGENADEKDKEKDKVENKEETNEKKTKFGFLKRKQNSSKQKLPKIQKKNQ